ncbi:MAG: hypothetical protein WCD79_22220 [Chthoniobacteraceae bacterium]
MTVKRAVLLRIAIYSFIGLFAFCALPIFTSNSPRSPIVVQLSRLHELGLVLRIYADDHGGKFPDKLSDHADEISNIQSEYSDLLHFHDPETKKPGDWLYFPGHGSSESPDIILAASPTVVVSKGRQWRIVLNLDGTCVISKETDFQQRIKKQLHRG